MKLLTWNVRGFRHVKLTSIEEIAENADLVILTETLSNVVVDSRWTVFNCLRERPDRSHGPGCGGVSMIHHGFSNFRFRTSIHCSHFQLIAGYLWSYPIVGAYVSPNSSLEEFNDFLSTITPLLRGSGILIGDLNARSIRWDDTNNRRGPRLAKWPSVSNFATQRPPTPTVINSSGSSRVDLCFVRSRFPPTITNYSRSIFSDHIPVDVVVRFGTPNDIVAIPLALFNDRSLCQTVSSIYNDNLAELVSAI